MLPETKVVINSFDAPNPNFFRRPFLAKMGGPLAPRGPGEGTQYKKGRGYMSLFIMWNNILEGLCKIGKFDKFSCELLRSI